MTGKILTATPIFKKACIIIGSPTDIVMSLPKKDFALYETTRILKSKSRYKIITNTPPIKPYSSTIIA